MFNKIRKLLGLCPHSWLDWEITEKVDLVDYLDRTVGKAVYQQKKCCKCGLIKIIKHKAIY